MKLPIDKTLEFYIRHNHNLAPFPEDFTVWMRTSGERFTDCGTVETQSAAFNRALTIANRGRRKVRFVEREW